MKVTALTPEVEQLSIPSKVRHAKEVLHLHREYKYLGLRLKRTKHVFNDIQRVQEAHFILEASGIDVNREQYDKYMEVSGEELVALYNRRSY